MPRLRRSTELQGSRDRHRAEPKDGLDELRNQNPTGHNRDCHDDFTDYL